MSEVKRYVWAGARGLAEQQNGNWVRHEDYAALEQRAEAAEAENRNYSELLSYHIDRQAKAEAAQAELKDEVVCHNNMAFHFQERAGKAEAKLAELAKQEPVAWRIGGDGCPEHLSDDKKYAYAYPRRTIEPLFTRAAPPAPFVVKFRRSYREQEEYPHLALHDLIEAIKAAGGSVADE